MRFITLRILCEGQTESNFVTQVLGPYLNSHRVYAKAEPLCRGSYGIVSYAKLRNAIKADVGRSRDHEYVTTMVDLYKLGRFPEANALPNESVYERVARIERGMAENLPNPRFVPYIQLHEFEALVLVDVDQIPLQFPDGEADGAPALLKRSIGNTEPELVNDGEATAPSKRIINAVPQYQHLKSIAGPAITAAIGLESLRAKCPHFNDWVTRLENLADVE